MAKDGAGFEMLWLGIHIVTRAGGIPKGFCYLSGPSSWTLAGRYMP